MFPDQDRPMRRLLAGAGFATGLILATLAPATQAADDLGEVTNTCTVSGGTATSSGDHFKCCWPGWGCVHCAVDGTTIHADQCWVDCESEACRDANARDRLGLPQTKKPPAATVPGTTPGTVAPSQNKKPKAADPNAGTVQ